MKDEVLNELKRYFAEDDITELFGEIINESMKVGTIREPYEIIRPCSTYAPWRKNTEFMDVYDKIKDNSLVDLYRCYELWKLVIQTKKCTSGDILEVGVYKGGTGALIASAAQYAQIDTKVFLCDTYEGIVKSGIKDNYHRNGDLDDTSVMLVQHLISRLKLNNVNIIKGVFPDDVADAFVEKKYRFVHIDVDIYDSAKDIFDFIWKSVESGGIVVFDDYGFTTTRGVTALLDEINDGITDGVFVHNINGHGIFIKTKNKSLC